MENGPVEIDDLPMKNAGFPSFFFVCLPINNGPLDPQDPEYPFPTG